MGIKIAKRKIKGRLIFFSVVFVILLYILSQFCFLMQGDYSKFIEAAKLLGPHIISCPFELGFDWILFGVSSIVYWAFAARALIRYKERKTHSATAEWMDNLKEYNKKFTFPKGSSKAEEKPSDSNNNMILADKLFLSMDTRQTRRNNNVMVIGGSGTGKSRFFVKPNLLQANCSFVVTDPAGELLESTGQFFLKKGYDVKVFNLVDMPNSNHYNPFDYVRDDNGIVQMVDVLIKNTTDPKAQTGDPFWANAEKMLLQAICYFLYYECASHERNFNNVMRLIRLAKVSEEDEGFESTLDRMFANLAKKNPNHMAVKKYEDFKQGAGKTLKSILISVLSRLNAFDAPAVQNLIAYDDIHFGSIGDKKSILYVITPSADTTFNFLVALMYTQMFETLYYHAEHDVYRIDDKSGETRFFTERKDAQDYLDNISSLEIKHTFGDIYELKGKNGTIASGRKDVIEKKKSDLAGAKMISTGKRLKSPVRFMLDEFANIGKIPDFDQKLATMRKYEISCSIILQNEAQLEAIYEKSSKTIKGNCDSFVFLGSPEIDSIKSLSELLGKENIKKINYTEQNKGGGNVNINQESGDLADITEIRTMDNDKCIVIVRSLLPFYGDKYDYPRHPNYKYTGDDNDKYKVTPRDIIDCDNKKDNRTDLSIETPVQSTREEIVKENDRNTTVVQKRRLALAKKESEKKVKEEIKPFDAATAGALQKKKNNKVVDGFVPDYEYRVPESIANKSFLEAISEKISEDDEDYPEIDDIDYT